MADPQTTSTPPAASNDSNLPSSTETSDGEALVRRSSKTSDVVAVGELSSTTEENSPKVEELPIQEEVLTSLQETNIEEKKIVEPRDEPMTVNTKVRKTLFQKAMDKVIAEEEKEKEAKKKEEEEVAKDVIPPKPPTPEKRAAPYIARPHPKILYKIERELKENRYYLMGKRVFGDPKAPDSCTFFVIGDIGKRYHVKLRQFRSCQCGDFLEDRLCTHIMFIMSKFFKLKKYDPLNWQRALLSSELRTLLSDPRITSSTKIEKKEKFVSKLFPPKLAPPVDVNHDKAVGPEGSEKGIGPQFCPICLEQFNFIAETPAVPYIGPIPWKPKFMPKLDMGPPKCIQDDKNEKARLENAMKKHEEEMASLGKQGDANVDNNVPKEDVKGEEKAETKAKEGGDEKIAPDTGNPESDLQSSENKTTGVTNPITNEDDELDALRPLRKYEPIWFCPDPDCRGDNVCFKMVHEWCYKKFDNFGIYPRGKQCPILALI